MKTLLVGCGGMGVRTLVRLNGMLAECPATRRTLDRDVAYIAVDTEQHPLELFESEIRGQMRNATMPVVRTVNLTRGASSVEEIVRAYFDRETDGVAAARLYEHWWCNPETDAAYRAERVKGLNGPAGMNATESYLLTWFFMPQADQVFDSVLSGIGYEKGVDAETAPRLRVFFVASLAGATGRGAWALLAMKLRQRLLRRGILASVEGCFFDASCFCGDGNVPGVGSLMANSLLGLSELSAWLNVAAGQSTYTLTLPGLRTLGDDLRRDIDFPKCVPPSSRAPVQAANLVFGDGDGAAFSKTGVCRETMATGLFARIVGADAIDSLHINSLSEVRGIAALSLRVDTEGILQYLEKEELCRRIQLVLSENHGDSAWENAVLEKAGLNDSVTWGVRDISSLACDQDAYGFEPVARMLRERPRFDEGDVEALVRQSLLDMSKMSDAVASAEKCFSDRGLDEGHMNATFYAAVFPDCDGNMWHDSSLIRVRIGTQCLLRKLRDEKRCAVESDCVIVDGVSCKTAEEVADAFMNGSFRNACRRRMLFSRRMPDAVIDGLAEAFECARREIIWLFVRPMVVSRLAVLVSAMENVDSSVALIVAGLKRIAADVARENELAYPQLFTDSTHEAIICDLRNLFSSSGYVSRVLKPIMSRNDLCMFMCDSESCYKRFLKRLSGALAEGELVSMESNDGVDGRLWTILSEELLQLQTWRETMGDRFSFGEVFRRNVDALNAYFDLPDFREAISELIWIGKSPELYLSQVYLDVVLGMARSCTCKMEFSPDVTRERHLCVLLPFVLSDAVDTAEMEHVLTASPMATRVSILSMPTLDRIVVYAETFSGESSTATERSPLHDISSLDYWKRYELGEILRIAEDSAGAAYFKSGEGLFRSCERARANGFTSPIFVRHSEMSDGRWKPWTVQRPDLTRDEPSPDDTRPYDVFISYRRDGGVDPARMLALKLEGPAYGYKVFFDQDSIRQGVFNQAIFKAIDECRYFVLVVTEGAFDRCVEEDDWVRQEVERALRAGKMIVPVAPYPEKFCAFPKDLPPSMTGLANLQIAELNMRQLFDVSVRQMVGARFV